MIAANEGRAINRSDLKKETAQRLLRKYRVGLCSKPEQQIIDHWYSLLEEPEKNSTNFLPTDVEKLQAHILKNIYDQIEHNERRINFIHPRLQQAALVFLNFERIRKVAAVVTFGLCLNCLFPFEYSHVGSKEMRAVEMTSINKNSQQSTIYLSDGSVVWLKALSKLEFPTEFTGASREVSLIGEAFFDIAPDSLRPFIIRSPNFTTEVVGTTFNIKAYPENNAQEVTVVTGRVMVSVNHPSGADDRALILRPHQTAIYSKAENSFTPMSTVQSRASDFLDKQKLLFNETSLEDILKVLAGTYKVKIALGDSNLKKCRITADLRNETLQRSIEVLAIAMGCKFHINENVIELSGRGC